MDPVRTQTVLGGRYVLEEELGRRPPVTIWRARDRVLERPVAVELLPGEQGDPLPARFLAAVEAAAPLSHPNLVSVFDAAADRGVVYAVAELVDGDALADRLAAGGPMAPERAIEVTRDVLAALEHVHAAGRAHGGLDPTRVLLGRDGRARVTDVGLAGIDPSAAPATPPEDVRAAGGILYACLTGRPPDRPPLAPTALRPGVPRPIEAIAMRALDGGYGDAAAFASALDRLAIPGEAEPPRLSDPAPVASPGPRRPSTFRSWFLVPLLLGIVVAGLLVAGFALGRIGVGPLRDLEPDERGRAASRERLEIVSTASLDPPPGDGRESEDDLPFAIDGDETTDWHTENYYDGTLNKPGVGLVLELREPATVSAVRLVTPAPGFEYEIRVGDDPEALLEAEGTGPIEAEADAVVRLESPVEGRYVLLWITTVVPTGDANRAVVAEVEVFGG